MRPTVTALALFLSLSAPAAAENFITPSVRAALEAILQQAPRWTSVYMRVYATTGKFYRIEENTLGVNLSGDRDSENRFRFSGRSDAKFLSFTAIPRSRDRDDGFIVSGGGVNLTLWPAGHDYRVWGDVETKTFDLFIDHWGARDFRITGQGGMNLTTQSMGEDLIATGQIDLARFDKTRLAVLGALLTIIRANQPPAAGSAGKP